MCSPHIPSPHTWTWAQHANQRTWKFLAKPCCVVAQHGGGGTLSFWKDIVFIHVLLAFVECEMPSAGIFTAQWMYLALEHEETWALSHLGSVTTPVALGELIFLSGSQFLFINHGTWIPWALISYDSTCFYFWTMKKYFFFYFKVIATPNPHGICSALYFCEGWQAFCAVFGVTGTISFSFQLLSSSCHSTKEVFATMVKGDLWLSSFGSRFKCSSENLQSSSSGSVPHLELDGVHGSCLLLFLAALGERTSGLSGSRICGGAWKGERFL